MLLTTGTVHGIVDSHGDVSWMCVDVDEAGQYRLSIEVDRVSIVYVVRVAGPCDPAVRNFERRNEVVLAAAREDLSVYKNLLVARRHSSKQQCRTARLGTRAILQQFQRLLFTHALAADFFSARACCIH